MLHAIKNLEVADNVLQFPDLKLVDNNTDKKAESTTQSKYKSNGVLKPTAAEPIRRMEDVHAMQQWFLDHGQFRNYTIFTLGISWALRAGDLLSIEIGDVCDIDGAIYDHFVIYEDKTDKRQEIIITEENRKLLARYIDTLDRKYPWDPLFQSRQRGKNGDKKAINLNRLNQILYQAAAECGIKEHISTHSLRKTFVYHMIKAHEGDQETLLLLQKMLNHSDLRITFRYCGIEKERTTELRNEISALLHM